MSENQQQLHNLVQKKSAVEWFKGLFLQAHLEITDTGEKFTIIHHGDHAEVLTGFRAEKPNFVIPLESENIRRLTAAFSKDKPTAQEQYRIVKFMLKPCLEAMLAMPILTNKALLKIIKLDTHWQEALLDPQGNEGEQLTVIFINEQWLIFSGYHGRPQRRLVFKPEQVLDFLRRVYEADESGSLSNWLSLASWYVKWREEITVPV
jgi:hypothetical protein